MRWGHTVASGIVIFSFLISVYFFPYMPEKFASHWNACGEVDGYLPKFWGLFLIPFLLFGFLSVFIVIPKIDPMKANVKKFRNYYDGFIVLFFVFLLFIHIQMILWNLGIKISPNVTVPIGLGALLFYVGILCENVERNWFIGIRTPWTLTNERVWKKTHRMAGRLFKIAGIFASIGIFFRNYAIIFAVLPVLVVTIGLIIYSYTEYQKETGKEVDK